MDRVKSILSCGSFGAVIVMRNNSPNKTYKNKYSIYSIMEIVSKMDNLSYNGIETGERESVGIDVANVAEESMENMLYEQTGENIANCSLEEFQKKYMCGNSPVVSRMNTPYGSRNGSRNGSRHGSDSEDNEESVRRMITLRKPATENMSLVLIENGTSNDVVSRPKYEKLTITDVEKSLSKYYDSGDNSSHELDLLTTWLTGLISLLKYSKNLNTVKMWMYMIFSASISTSIAFIVPFTYHDQFWNLVYICGSSALNVIIAIVVLWSKFEYDARTFEIVVSQYKHAYNILEPSLIDEHGREMSMETIRHNMELQITGINTHFPFIIPYEVSCMYPLLSHTNIFDVIKKIELYRKNLMVKFRDIKNEIRLIIYKWTLSGVVDYIVSSEEIKLTSKQLKEKKRFLYLLRAKEETKNELLGMRNIYSQLANLFVDEIKYANTHKFMYTLSTLVYKKPTTEITNQVLKDYLRLIQ